MYISYFPNPEITRTGTNSSARLTALNYFYKEAFFIGLFITFFGPPGVAITPIILEVRFFFFEDILSPLPSLGVRL